MSVQASIETGEVEDRPAYWSAVFAMTLCVFALIASEFMLVSLLANRVRSPGHRGSGRPRHRDLRRLRRPHQPVHFQTGGPHGSQAASALADARHGGLGNDRRRCAQLPALHAWSRAHRRRYRWLLVDVGRDRHPSRSRSSGAESFGDLQCRQCACNRDRRSPGKLPRRNHRVARRVLRRRSHRASGSDVAMDQPSLDEGRNRTRFCECVQATEAPSGAPRDGVRRPVLHGPVRAVHLCPSVP